MTSRWQGTDAPRGDDYDARWRDLEDAGHDPHGEATFVMSFAPEAVLDAGCGTGRVAIELDRRGVECTGVDLDPSMLDAARRKAPSIRWIEADLADLVGGVDADAGEVRAGYDVIVLAGNVMIFLEPGTEARVVLNMARQLRPGGRLVTGFTVAPDRYQPVELDRDAAAAGLVLVERWATWDRQEWSAESDYAVSVHTRASGGG